MSICPSCQAANPDSHQFCQFCDTKISMDIGSMDISGDVTENIAADVATDVAVNFSSDQNPDQTSNQTTEQTSDETQALNLEGMLGKIEIQIEELTSSQVANNTKESSNELNEVSEELPLEIIPQDFSDKKPDVAIAIPSTTYLQDITYAGKTDVGRQRDRNEDDFATIFQTRNIDGKSQISDRNYHGLFILCDGMGGHEGGAEASAIAVNSILEQFRPFWMDTLLGEAKLEEIIWNANQAIFIKNDSEQRQDLGRMGTTLVMLVMHDLEMAIAHVGDSRIYKVTNSPNLQTENLENPLEKSSPKLEQITRDHEVLNQLIDLGIDLETAQSRPDAHQLTQALGPNPSDRLSPSMHFFTLNEPTLFLLCSDGLCDNDAIEQNWRSHLLPILNKEIDLQTGLDNLIELGNNVNGHDNLTAILVLCDLADSVSKHLEQDKKLQK